MRANTSVVKLGFVIRNEIPRNRVEQALFRNAERARQQRASLREEDGGSGGAR